MDNGAYPRFGASRYAGSGIIDQVESGMEYRQDRPARARHAAEQHSAEYSLSAHQQLQADYARVLARAEQHEHQVQTLSALSQSVAVSLDGDDLRQSIVESFYEAMRADTTSLFVREADGTLRMVAQCNIDLTRARIVFGPDDGLVALAARERRVVHVPDTASSTFYLATGHDHPRSLLAVPVEPQTGPDYVLCVVRRRVYAFTDDEVAFAGLMASVAAHALSNAALYHEMSALAREQATLYELTRASSLSDGIASFIGRIADPLRRALNAAGCAIIMLEAPQRANQGMSAFSLDRAAAFGAELAASRANVVALRCEVSPTGARLILAAVVTRRHPVAVIAWEMLAGEPEATPLDLWDAVPDDLDGVPQLPLGASAPLHEAETSFITNVCQQVALGLDNLRLRARDISALRSMSALPASRAHLDDVRRAIVREVAEVFAPATVALLLRDEAGAPYLAVASQPGQPAWVRAALAQAAHGTRDVQQQRGIVLVALQADGETFGWLALRLTGEARLSADRALVFTSLAGTAALLLRNARLHLIAREAAVDRERHRIAREIHDGVAQNLAHLMLRLELVQRLVTSDPARAQAEAEGARGVLLSSLNELRQSIAALAPAQLEELGFAGAVQQLLDDIATNAPDLTVSFTAVAEHDILPELRAPAFRVVQEALSNIRKHAHASHAWIDVARDGDRALVVTVRDDGQGFDPLPTSPAYGHFGLRGMRERAEEFGGALTIASSPGQGTTITLALPLRLAA
jgi:signal transduction histidine kinase